MGNTSNTILLIIKSKFNCEVINSYIIIINIIHNKPANLISKAKFKYNAINSISIIKATILIKLL